MLVTAGLSEELQAESMDASTGQAFIAIQRAINIGKIHGQKGVVFVDRRAQEQRPLLIESQREAGKMSAFGVE